jgi:hypothetical protein
MHSLLDKVVVGVLIVLISATFLGAVQTVLQVNTLTSKVQGMEYSHNQRFSAIETTLGEIKTQLAGKVIMKIKRGVVLEGCRKEILLAAMDIEHIFVNAGVDLIFTEGVATVKHRALRSSHYRGDGLDLRSKHLGTLERKKNVLAKIKRKLGPGFVVILENIGKNNEHFHLHWSPVYEATTDL